LPERRLPEQVSAADAAYVLASPRRIPRAWARAFPTELDNADRRAAAHSRQEFAPPRAGRGAAAGSTPPRSGARSRSTGFSGLCITKLDVLDGMEEVKLCTGYRMPDSGRTAAGGCGAALCEPVYENPSGWKDSTWSVRIRQAAGAGAAYLERLQAVCGVP